MWRITGGVIGVAAMVALFACGGGGDGGGDGDEQACRPDYSAAALQTRAGAVPQYSLDEALQRVPWLRTPSDLPVDAVMGRVAIQTVSGCPNDIMSAALHIDGAGYWILLEEFAGSPEGVGTPVAVDGVTGRLETRENGSASVIVTWEREGHGYSAAAKFGGELTQERLLEILNSMQ